MADDKLRILIVEDSLLTAHVLRDMLGAQPDMVVVDIAATGQDAVRLAAELRPDVILMDVHLPDIDGVNATWLMATRNSDSSVIMVTSEGRTEYLQRAMVAGAQGYLLKPILNPGEMANTIRTVRKRALERWALLTPTDSVPIEAMRTELAARAEGAEVLHRVTAEVAGRRDVREIAESAVKALRSLYHADAAAFYLLDAQNGLQPLVALGLSETYLGQLREVFDGRGTIPRLRLERSQVYADVATDARDDPLRDALLHEGIVTMVLVPAIAEGHALGGLVLYHHQTRSYRPHEIALLEIFAQQIGGAIGLAQAYAAVETLDRKREEFLALVSHELRQPVAAIALTAEVLADAPGLSLTEQRALSTLRRQATRLGRLAEDVLAIARLETGQFQLHRAPVDIGALVAALARQVPDPGRVHLELPAEPLVVDVDAERIGQAVDNLVSNALKYSRTEDPVGLTVRGTPTEVCVEVQDRGIGLTPAELSALFTKYGRVHDRATAGSDGVGLGLYLSRLLVGAHGGTLEATSAGRGCGTTFMITLPRGRTE